MNRTRPLPQHFAHQSTKTYGHDIGLSAVFRQWRAQSHCNQLHGYALAVRLVFKANTLDSRNWVVDFGALKEVKAWLQTNFDHQLLIAQDDPAWGQLRALDESGLAQTNLVKAVGCEAFAEMIGDYVTEWLMRSYLPGLREIGVTAPLNLHCAEVQVSEHGGNSASWFY